MGQRVRRMTAREVEALLLRYGFQIASQKGSHRKWRHEHRAVQVIVPEHGARPLPVGTLLAILKTAEIPDEEWRS